MAERAAWGHPDASVDAHRSTPSLLPWPTRIGFGLPASAHTLSSTATTAAALKPKLGTNTGENRMKTHHGRDAQRCPRHQPVVDDVPRLPDGYDIRRRKVVGVTPVARRNAAVNELVSLYPRRRPISVIECVR